MRLEAKCGHEDVLRLGLTCSHEEPCPVYLELTDIEAVGNKLFVSGNLHTASSTLESVLLGSEDLGRTWTEPHERIPSAGLENIQFIDFETGWAAGQVLLALPRDAFLLLTTDGGKNWRKRPIYGETRVGAIDRFWFESRTDGTLLMDRIQAGETGMRHELYESRTGGESWMLRQVDSKPIPVKPPEPAATSWRLRPDAASKSYRIENKQGDKWTPIASLLIAAGECKPPAPAEAQPPPPPEEPPATDKLVIPSRPSVRPAKPPSLKGSK